MKIVENTTYKLVIQKDHFAYISDPSDSSMESSNNHLFLYLMILLSFGTMFLILHLSISFPDSNLYFIPAVLAYLAIVIWILYCASSSPDILIFDKVERSAYLKRKRWLVEEVIRIPFRNISIKIIINRNRRINDYKMIFLKPDKDKNLNIIFLFPKDFREAISNFLEIEIPSSLNNFTSKDSIQVSFQEVPWNYEILEYTSSRLVVHNIYFDKDTDELLIKKPKKHKHFISEISDVFLMIYEDKNPDIEIMLTSGKKIYLDLYPKLFLSNKFIKRDMKDMAKIIRQFLNINSDLPLIRYEYDDMYDSELEEE